MTTVAGTKREREDDSKKNESETKVNEKVEEKKETVDNKDEPSKEKSQDKKEEDKKENDVKKDEKKEDDKKDEKEPETKKAKLDETANNTPQKKIFGASFSNTSFSSFSSYKSTFGSGSTNKASFSTFGSSFGNSSKTNSSFDSLLKSEGKPFNEKKEEKTEEKVSQFKETETKTGEEDEECIHSIRAKLYEDEDDKWKERGIGLLKINCNKENKSKVRLVMRAEGILRVILNERIIPSMKFTIIQDRYISFAAISDKKTIKKYLIKTGTIMSANELYQALLKAIPKE